MGFVSNSAGLELEGIKKGVIDTAEIHTLVTVL